MFELTVSFVGLYVMQNQARGAAAYKGIFSYKKAGDSAELT
jgi:hypothetical protein